jgi:hypothetical protein
LCFVTRKLSVSLCVFVPANRAAVPVPEWALVLLKTGGVMEVHRV